MPRGVDQNGFSTLEYLDLNGSELDGLTHRTGNGGRGRVGSRELAHLVRIRLHTEQNLLKNHVLPTPMVA